MFGRIESLSHLLFWGRLDGQQTSVTRVELPRLGLSFSAKHAANTTTRFHCEQHAGCWVTDHRQPEAVALLSGLPHAILLENSSKDLFILLSAAVKPARPLEVQTSDAFASELLLARGDAEWLEGLGKVRHYLYPIHVSKMFLVMPSLAAALHLLLLRFLQRQYAAVASLVTAVVSDTDLSPEESQLWAQLGCVLSDMQPDALACRLRISMATEASPKMTCPWDLEEELDAYAR